MMDDDAALAEIARQMDAEEAIADASALAEIARQMEAEEATAAEPAPLLEDAAEAMLEGKLPSQTARRASAGAARDESKRPHDVCAAATQ